MKLVLALIALTMLAPATWGNSVVLFDDQFSGTSLNTSLWFTGTNSRNQSWTVSNGELLIDAGTQAGGGAWIRSHATFIPSVGRKLVLEARGRTEPMDGGYFGYWTPSGQQFAIAGDKNTGQLRLISNDGVGARVDEYLSGYDYSAYNTMRLEWGTDFVAFYINNDLLRYETSEIPSGPLQFRFDRVSWGQHEKMWLDYVTLTDAPISFVPAPMAALAAPVLLGLALRRRTPSC